MGIFDNIFRKEEDEQLPAYRYDFQATAQDPATNVVQDQNSVNDSTLPSAATPPTPAMSKTLAEIYGQTTAAQPGVVSDTPTVPNPSQPSVDPVMPNIMLENVPTQLPQSPSVNEMPSVDLPQAPINSVEASAPVNSELPVLPVDQPSVVTSAPEVPEMPTVSGGGAVPEVSPTDPVAAMGTDATVNQPAYMWDISSPVTSVAPSGSIEEKASVSSSPVTDDLSTVIAKLEEAVAALKEWQETQKASGDNNVVKTPPPPMADAYMQNKLDQINQQLDTPLENSSNPQTTV